MAATQSRETPPPLAATLGRLPFRLQAGRFLDPPFSLHDSRRRLTYLMLFRVAVVTVLLIATLFSDLATSAETSASPLVKTIFGLIVVTYGLSIIYSILLKRGANVARLTRAQLGSDLLLTTILVQLTGGVESGFVFLYLLIIIAAAFAVGRAAVVTAALAVALFGSAGIANWGGLLPDFVRPTPTLPLSALVRLFMVNTIAFAATGVLAARLTIELSNAGERIAKQRTQLRDLTALHQDVIRCLSSGLVTVLGDGRVLTFNAAAAEIIGCDAATVIGRPIVDLMPALKPVLDSLTEPAHLRRVEIVTEGDGGERTLGISISPLSSSDGEVLGRIINFQDLTELRRMEIKVARAERLAAIGQLAAGVAHEIRNPLAAISGSIELMQTGAQGDAESRELMDIVLREAERLNLLITELLDFARPRRPEPHRLEISADLGDMVRVFSNDKRLSGVPVHIHAPEMVWIDVDPGQLRQLMWNLLLNAAEASPEGSSIELRVARQIAVGRKRWAAVTVRDHGPGIAAEDRARIFDPFFSTKERGTGLGLATVQRIVEENHGEIVVGAPSDGGTAVMIRLPLADPPTII